MTELNNVMYALALDTTTRGGSVALVNDDRIVDERRGDSTRSHAERLPAELMELVSAHGLSVRDIDLFAVACGPGSFTGLRIGIATIQGLALATARPIVAVSALEALAAATLGERAEGLADAFIAAWMDARRGDVFAALYRVAAAPEFSPERLIAVEDPTVGDPKTTLARWRDRIGDARVALVGDGAALYEDEIRHTLIGATVVAQTPLIAGAIGRMATVRARRGETIHPAAIRPLYLRRPDAEVAREQLNAKAPPPSTQGTRR